MSTELTVINEKELISYLDTLGLANSLTNPEKTQFLSIAKAYGLNPFKREIYVSKYGSQMSILTGYEVYIKRAERTGMLDGWEVTTSGRVATNDLKATIKIYRKDRQYPFIWEAIYSECVQRTREGQVTKFWQKADFMTKKVAISQGFRLCFSDELAGMPFTSDEMPETQITKDITHVEIIEETKEIPDLTDVQMKKILNSTKATMEKALDAITNGKVEATQVQILQIENKLKELETINN